MRAFYFGKIIWGSSHPTKRLYTISSASRFFIGMSIGDNLSFEMKLKAFLTNRVHQIPADNLAHFRWSGVEFHKSRMKRAAAIFFSRAYQVKAISLSRETFLRFFYANRKNRSNRLPALKTSDTFKSFFHASPSCAAFSLMSLPQTFCVCGIF